MRKSLRGSSLHYTDGRGQNEEKSLHVLRELFIESYVTPRGGIARSSKNLKYLQEFAIDHDIHIPFSPDYRPKPQKWAAPKKRFLHMDENFIPTQHLLLVQCLYAPHVICTEISQIDGTYGFNESQQSVYSRRSEKPFFKGHNACDVDLMMVVHHLNFWKYWLTNDPMETLAGGFSRLDKHHRPKYFTTKLTNGAANLGYHWTGTYAFLDNDELDNLREDPSGTYIDQFPGEGEDDPFQDVQLQLQDDDSHYWPESFEQEVASQLQPELLAKTRAQRRALEKGEHFQPVSYRFGGNGTDQKDNFSANGWLNSLPSQMGVPGWQRLTMMKYYKNKDTDVIDDNSLWAYEGVVLPGGKIIVGRWWRAGVHDDDEDEFYSGPFILWCID